MYNNPSYFQFNSTIKFQQMFCILSLTEPGRSISSSVYQNISSKFSPDFATDGSWPIHRENTSLTIFSSEREDWPWLEWHLGSRSYVIGISIADRFYDVGDNLENVEIRAGTTSIDARLKENITENEFCGVFKGPGENYRVYIVMCENEIVADYITLQRLDTNSTLVVSEIEIITRENGKYFYCFSSSKYMALTQH